MLLTRRKIFERLRRLFRVADEALTRIMRREGGEANLATSQFKGITLGLIGWRHDRHKFTPTQFDFAHNRVWGCEMNESGLVFPVGLDYWVGVMYSSWWEFTKKERRKENKRKSLV